GWFTARRWHVQYPLESNGVVTLAMASGTVFLLAWAVGSIIMGIYLLVSLNVFGVHGNEAFSALRCEDWKNFLKLHIDSQGNLSIYPIGIDRVPRRWAKVESPRAGEPEVEPVA